jgi:hypothetical protein
MLSLTRRNWNQRQRIWLNKAGTNAPEVAERRIGQKRKQQMETGSSAFGAKRAGDLLIWSAFQNMDYEGSGQITLGWQKSLGPSKLYR